MADDNTKNLNETDAQREENARQEADKREREDAEKARKERDEAEGTSALEAKSPAALTDPDKDVGDHFAQKFANQPANPKDAPNLKEVEDDAKVRLELTDSDHPDPANPKVTFVHPDMVGDYLRAGWRQPSA